MLNDAIQASFEIGASIASLLNIRQIMKDRQVKGVSPWPTVFFMTWGVWNLYFYYDIQLPLAWCAAGLMLAVNIWWLYLYRKFNYVR